MASPLVKAEFQTTRGDESRNACDEEQLSQMNMGASSAAKSTVKQIENAGQANRIDSVPTHWIQYKAGFVLIILLAGFISLESLLPLGTALKIGADEGYESAKAILSVHGYHFYSEVWNDQPPVYTFLLAQIIKHVSSAILWPRLLTVAFATVLLAGVFVATLRLHGLLVATITTMWLMAAPGFIELSSSVMQEIPALAPVIVALCLLLVVKRNKWRLGEVMAGVFFAVALQMKLIGIIYLPLAGLILWLQNRAEVESKTGKGNGVFLPIRLWYSALVFALSLAIVFIAIDWFIDRGAYLKHFQQSWSAHFGTAQSFERGSPQEHPFDWTVLLKNWDTTVPALIGVLVLVWQIRQTPLLLVPLSWLALTLAVFGFHKPWWSYYYVHNAIPLSWCAAVGVAGLLQLIRSGRQKALSGLLTVALLGMLGWMGARVWLEVGGIRQSPRLYTELALPEVQRLKPFTDFLYTDEPIYSFHAGIPLPPQLGVISLKRFWSGDLTTAQFIEDLRAAEPGLMLMANNQRKQWFNDWLDEKYRLIYEDAEHRLYASRTLLARARQSGVRQ